MSDTAVATRGMAVGGPGVLQRGAVADITLVDLDNTRCQPVHRASSALVYNASGADIHMVVVGGRIVVDHGHLVAGDEAELMAQCRKAAAALLRRAEISV